MERHIFAARDSPARSPPDLNFEHQNSIRALAGLPFTVILRLFCISAYYDYWNKGLEPWQNERAAKERARSRMARK
jgi:hypothetical protein